LKHTQTSNPFKCHAAPLTKKVDVERDRVLSDEEITQISKALATKLEWAEALFFFQLAVITGLAWQNSYECVEKNLCLPRNGETLFF